MAKNPASTSLTERKLQQLIVDLIKNDALSSAIEGAEAIQDLVEQRKNENVFPIFSMDHLVRMSCAEAAAHGLNSLTNLVLLTGDQNISITDREALRPDIVCYNPEGETLILIELKKSSQAGRQALTELIAYEQELKNQLPFLSDYETVYVLISTEWSTLIDHAVASAVTWSGRQLLCLDATVTGNDVSLKPRLPGAWHITGSANFPAHSLPCVTYCLYDYKPSDKAHDGLDMRLLSALNLMAREGDRIGGHGFALLWRDHLGISQAEYNITVCGVAPFEFYKAMRERGVIGSAQGELIEPLDQLVSDFDPQGHSGSLMKVMEATRPLLGEISRPHYEGFMDWETALPGLVLRAEPLSCEFWGVPGDFVRYFTTHPAVRSHKPHLFNDGQFDWRDPQVGITLLDSFLAPEAFQDGNVRCSDCLKLGSVLGLDFLLRQNLAVLKGDTRRPFYCRFLWNFYKLSALLEEVRMLTSSAKNVDGPEIPYVLSNDPNRHSDENNKAFTDWLKKDFLQGSYAHGLLFSIGLTGALQWDIASRDLISPEGKKQINDGLAPLLKLALTIVLGRLAQLKSEDGLSADHKTHSKILFETLGITEEPTETNIDAIISALSIESLVGALPLIVRLADMLIDAVFHQHADTSPLMPDWDWLQQGIKEMYARGIQYPAVHLLANGTLTTGPVERDGVGWMRQLADLQNEVLFCDHSSGLMMAINTTWDELKSGKHFSVG
jgi:hypothetical protein